MNFGEYEGEYEVHIIEGKSYKVKKISAMRRSPEFEDFPLINPKPPIHNEQNFKPIVEKRKRKKTIKLKKRRVKKTSYGFNGDLTNW